MSPTSGRLRPAITKRATSARRKAPLASSWGPQARPLRSALTGPPVARNGLKAGQEGSRIEQRDRVLYGVEIGHQAVHLAQLVLDLTREFSVLALEACDGVRRERRHIRYLGSDAVTEAAIQVFATKCREVDGVGSRTKSKATIRRKSPPETSNRTRSPFSTFAFEKA